MAGLQKSKGQSRIFSGRVGFADAEKGNVGKKGMMKEG
jgi:hypothetical protein